MKFINYTQGDGAEGLFIDNTASPIPGPDEVLVKVKAFGLNRADLLQCAGHYPPPEGASEILGLECSGIVQVTGDQVTTWKEGDAVCGLVDGGTYAEYCVMDAGMIWRKPERLSWAEAAAIPEAFLTAYQALFTLMDVNQMEHVLIHAAASGVGSAAIGLVRDLPLTVYGTVSERKMEYCLEIGYDNLINYKEESFLSKIHEWTNNKGVDGILDFVGGSNFQDNIKALSQDGTMVMLGTLGGVKTDGMNILPIISRRLTIKGSTLRSRNKAYKRKLIAGFLNRFEKMFQDGSLRPSIYQDLNWYDTGTAHQMMNRNENTGKIVLVID